MAKDVKVITPKGYTKSVAEHMVKDLLKFGCVLNAPVRKETPEELRRPLKEVKIQPAKVITPEPAKNPLPEMQNSVKSDLPQTTESIEKPERKKPVRSKSTK